MTKKVVSTTSLIKLLPAKTTAQPLAASAIKIRCLLSSLLEIISLVLCLQVFDLPFSLGIITSAGSRNLGRKSWALDLRPNKLVLRKQPRCETISKLDRLPVWLF